MTEQVLADTSVWVDHLRRRSAGLVELLGASRIHVHAFVIGELACGNLAQRASATGLALWTLDRRLARAATDLDVAPRLVPA